MHLRSQVVVAALVASGLVAGCASAPVVPVSKIDLKYEVPVLSLVPPATEAQTRGSVTAKLTNPHFAARIEKRTYCGRSKVVDLGALAGGATYTVTTSPAAVVEQEVIGLRELTGNKDPKSLAPTYDEPYFALYIANGLKQIVQLDGVVFTRTVNGREQQIDFHGTPFDENAPPRREARTMRELRAELKDIADGKGPPDTSKRRILPGHFETFLVFHPGLDKLPDGTRISYALYDVVTATAPNGDPKERQTYTWTYVLNRSSKVEPSERTQEQMKDTDPRFQGLCARSIRGEGAEVTGQQAPKAQ